MCTLGNVRGGSVLAHGGYVGIFSSTRKRIIVQLRYW
ncbi:MAG: hypothetical protein RIS36_1881 [Pseudomonadota bacterium]